MPKALEIAVFEIMQAANLSFGLCPMLTQGAIEAIEKNGDARQKALYLPRLVSGEWTGTMNLTEPQAGSDLGALTTRPSRTATAWRLTGQKIFITWGDHDMADNIVHLVLARLPDAPPGSRGISLFLAPKRLVRRGRLARRGQRACRCGSIEHKLGIHASPTCVMLYEGAKAELVGAPNAGPGGDVRDDERRAAAGRRAGRRHRRARLPAGAGLCAGAQAGPLGLDRRPIRRGSSTIRTCAAR